jgi:2-amino-4-hydroxy-6-hydroxymethyldihydropteridine diphosphokinase
MNRVIIGLGSNILPEENIGKALEELGNIITIVKTTVLLRTKPVGIIDQPDFLNGALLAETNLDKESLEVFLKSMEDRLGRDRTLPKFGPRTIDLDIIVWNGEILDKDYYTRDYLRELTDELM